MSGTDAPTASLPELKQFLEFVSGLWGLLAGISTLFPLSNLLIEVVPLDQLPAGGYAYLPGSAVSVVASLSCVFVVLWTFGQRAAAVRWARATVHRRAWRCFLGALAALVLYYVLYLALAHDFYWIVLHWESGALQRLLGDVLLLLLYVTCFSLLTRAFLLLALHEFVRAQARPRRTRAKPVP
jgi:hypothetical protein